MTLVSVGIFFITQFKSQITDTFNQSITVPSNVRTTISELMSLPRSSDRDSQISYELSHLAFANTTEIFVVDLEGNVVGVSSKNGDVKINDVIGNKSNKDKEIQKLLDVDNKADSNYVYDVKDQQITQMTSPIIDVDNNQSQGVVVSVSNSSDLNKILSGTTTTFIGTAFLPVLAALLLSSYLFRFLTDPISQISKQIQGLANGNLYLRNTVTGDDEIGLLAQDVNRLSQVLQDSDEDLLNEHSRLNSILENMSDGVLVINRSGKITLINDMAVNLLNENRKNLMNKLVIKVLHLDKQKLNLRDLFKNEEPIIVDLSDPNDELIISVTPSIIRRNSGLITGAVLVMHDITTQEHVEAERKNFVSNVSHELRTPLTSVSSYLETLIDEDVTDKKTTRQFLEIAYKETQRMARMVSELFVLSRMDQKTQDINLSEVNLTETINYLVDRFEFNTQTNGEEKKFEFIKKLSKKNITVNIDQDKFAQVVDNILTNAVKYSLDGGKITVATKVLENTVDISISDQGLGIPKKDLGNIFKRFYRVDKARSRAQGGSGLGLSISKEIIELLNGRITVNSIEGNGTTFTISLPLVNKK